MLRICWNIGYYILDWLQEQQPCPPSFSLVWLKARAVTLLRQRTVSVRRDGSSSPASIWRCKMTIKWEQEPCYMYIFIFIQECFHGQETQIALFYYVYLLLLMYWLLVVSQILHWTESALHSFAEFLSIAHASNHLSHYFSSKISKYHSPHLQGADWRTAWLELVSEKGKALWVWVKGRRAC